MADTGLSVRVAQEAPIPLTAAFTVAPGEMLALVGPSGSGKSSLLRAVAGLHRPAQGRIAVAGAPWLDSDWGIHRPAKRRQVGYVFQSYALFPHLSAAGNVAAAMRHRPRDQRRQAAAELLARLHLAGLEDRRPAQLSGGQQQRVALARALARDPAVLLLDEPFAAVDRVTRERLQRELAALRRDVDIPAILVTHDLEEAARLGDRIGVIHHGRLLQLDSPETVMYRPASPLVARLIDLRNVFSATVTGHDAAAETTYLAWQGRTLEAAYNPAYTPGSTVSWCIPADSIMLHRRDRPSRGEKENPVSGTVQEALRLGELTHVRIALPGTPNPMHLTVPSHVAWRNKVADGEPIGVSLRAAAIHLMPPEDGGAEARPRDL